jgi:hypothetical protein
MALNSRGFFIHLVVQHALANWDYEVIIAAPTEKRPDMHASILASTTAVYSSSD